MMNEWLSRFFSATPRTTDKRPILTRAEEGDADAQFVMGVKLSSGKAENQDLAEAAEWYRKAAQQNHLLAQYNLGIMLSKGQGVERDEKEALAWTSRAAYGGDAGAQFQMGNRLSRADVHHSENDATEAMIEAYKWFQLAAAQGYKASVAHCERMTFRMTRGDVSKGNERVSAFVPTLAAA